MTDTSKRPGSSYQHGYRPPTLDVSPIVWEKMKKLGWIKDGRLDWEKVATDLDCESAAREAIGGGE